MRCSSNAQRLILRGEARAAEPELSFPLEFSFAAVSPRICTERAFPRILPLLDAIQRRLTRVNIELKVVLTHFEHFAPPQSVPSRYPLIVQPA
jgi:hypothetical protein